MKLRWSVKTTGRPESGHSGCFGFFTIAEASSSRVGYCKLDFFKALLMETSGMYIISEASSPALRSPLGTGVTITPQYVPEACVQTITVNPSRACDRTTNASSIFLARAHEVQHAALPSFSCDSGLAGHALCASAEVWKQRIRQNPQWRFYEDTPLPALTHKSIQIKCHIYFFLSRSLKCLLCFGVFFLIA